MFDLNYDGKMSALEHAIELQLIDTITKNNAEMISGMMKMMGTTMN